MNHLIPLHDRLVLTLSVLILFSFQSQAQDLEFDFRKAPLSYWQQEFGSITQSAHWTLPDTRGRGIILRNVGGYGSHVDIKSHPFIPNGWSGNIIIGNWAPSPPWCGAMEVRVKRYSDNAVLIEDGYNTYGTNRPDSLKFRQLMKEVNGPNLKIVTCNDPQGCYIQIRMSQGYGTGNSDMNFLEFIRFTNYYGHQNLSQTADGNVGISGNVSIGAESSDMYRLQVGGEVRATGVTVEATPWPDYVFEEDYELRSLKEVDGYIRKHKHLPDIPSAKEIKSTGLDLGEINRLLIQKIEEITLYQIQLQYQIEQQSKEIQRLKHQLSEDE